MARAAELRRRIQEADETVSDWDLRDLWDEVRFELNKVRLFGDLATTAFFEASKPRERTVKRDEYAGAVFAGDFKNYREEIEQRRRESPPLAPFHWEIEFPEVFDRTPPATAADAAGRPGFDAIVGNPPFAGKNTVAAANVAGYSDWLKQVHAKSHGNADLVAHFFRRAFALLRRDGTFGRAPGARRRAPPTATSLAPAPGAPYGRSKLAAEPSSSRATQSSSRPRWGDADAYRGVSPVRFVLWQV